MLDGYWSRYATHAGRQTVEHADIALLMDRQRLTMGPNTPSVQDLARRHLPMELLTDLLPVAIASNTVAPPPKKRRRHVGGNDRRGATDGEGDSDDDDRD